jgi:integrase
MRGHIRRRGDKWSVVIDEGRDGDGKRKQRWLSGYETKRAATAALTDVLSRVQTGTYVQPTKETVGTFMRRWLDGKARLTLRPSTWQSYKTNVDAYIVPALGGVPLQDLSTARLDAFYADLLAHGRRARPGGLSPRTVRFTHQILRGALKDAVRDHVLLRNPCEYATLPRGHGAEMKVWSAVELRAFLEQVHDDRLYPAWLLTATTGLRRGELLGLRWRDVDLDAGRIAVRQTLLSVQSTLVFSTPKTAKGQRSVALDPVTTATLRAHKVRQNEERLALGGWPDHDLCFTREDGEPVHPDRFSREIFDRHTRAAGLQRIRFHDLRHSYATLALSAGIHPKVVSERLGHATISITLDTYSHVVPAMQEEAAAKVAALMLG